MGSARLCLSHCSFTEFVSNGERGGRHMHTAVPCPCPLRAATRLPSREGTLGHAAWFPRKAALRASGRRRRGPSHVRSARSVTDCVPLTTGTQGASRPGDTRPRPLEGGGRRQQGPSSEEPGRAVCSAPPGGPRALPRAGQCVQRGLRRSRASRTFCLFFPLEIGVSLRAHVGFLLMSTK